MEQKNKRGLLLPKIVLNADNDKKTGIKPYLEIVFTFYFP